MSSALSRPRVLGRAAFCRDHGALRENECRIRDARPELPASGAGGRPRAVHSVLVLTPLLRSVGVGHMLYHWYGCGRLSAELHADNSSHIGNHVNH